MSIRYVPLMLCLCALLACSKENKEILEKEIYEGPIMQIAAVETLYSDSARVRIKISSPSEMVFSNGDREYPEGIFLEFYDKLGELTTTYQSDKAYYIKETNLYRGVGNVIVTQLTNGDQLNTEELFWSPNEELVYTEKFVTIKTEDEVHTGEGLEASQNFDTYKIIKPTGTLSIE